jgi:hypothetical protein
VVKNHPCAVHILSGEYIRGLSLPLFSTTGGHFEILVHAKLCGGDFNNGAVIWILAFSIAGHSGESPKIYRLDNQSPGYSAAHKVRPRDENNATQFALSTALNFERKTRSCIDNKYIQKVLLAAMLCEIGVHPPTARLHCESGVVSRSGWDRSERV